MLRASRTSLHVTMESRLAQLHPPLLTPNHQCDYGDEEDELDDAECGPGPSKTSHVCERQSVVSYSKGEAATKVEEHATLWCLWLVAIGNVGVQTGGGYLKSENAWILFSNANLER